MSWRRGQRASLARRRASQRVKSTGPARSDRLAATKLVGRSRLSAMDKLDKRPEVHSGNLDYVIAFLPKRRGNGPATVGRDVKYHHAKAKILHLGDDLGEVLVGARDEGVADSPVLGQGD